MRFLRPDGVHLNDVRNKCDIIFDHGPQLPSGWDILPLKNGLEIKKRFIIPSKQTNRAELELRLVVFQSCTLQYRLNDMEEQTLVLTGPEPGKTAITRNIRIPVQYPALDGVYRFRIESISLSGSNQTAAGLFVDFRRNYGRTEIDREIFPGEAVIRLECFSGFSSANGQ